MDYEKTLEELKHMKVETGSFVCLGCEHEHNCSIHGCAILRDTVECIEEMKRVLRESEAARADLGKRMAAVQQELAAYKDTGMEPEEIKNALDVNDIIPEINVTVDHICDLLKAEQEGRLVELPFVAMVEQSLQDGKMKPMGDQKHNGRYAVVYVDHNKWKSPLIDICGKPYNREEAENRMAALAQEGESDGN